MGFSPSVKLNNTKMTSFYDFKRLGSRMNASKSSSAAMVASGNNTYGTNLLKTSANRFKTVPQAISSSTLSRQLNATQYLGASNAVKFTQLGGLNGLSYGQNITQSNGTVGAGWAFAQVGLATLNKLIDSGIIGGSKSEGSSSSSKLSQGMSSLGSAKFVSVDSGQTGAAGIQTASSFGSNFDATFSTIESYMKSDTIDPAGLRKSAKDLVSTAYSDINNAEANYNILKSRESDCMSNLKSLNEDVGKAETDKNNANKALGESQGVLKGAKKDRADKDAVLSQTDSDYKEACSKLNNAETAKETAQKNVTTCKTGVTNATTSLNQAKANTAAAEQALASASPEQKASAQAALDRAKEAQNKAQTALDKANEELKQAEGKLEEANKNVTDARTAKNNKLNEMSKAKDADKAAIKACQDAEGRVEKSQDQYDVSLEIADTCNNSYTEAKAKLDDAQGVSKQLTEYESKISTLKDNLKRAVKLQEKAEKAASKYENKHPAAADTTTSTPIKSNTNKSTPATPQHQGAVSSSNKNSGSINWNNMSNNNAGWNKYSSNPQNNSGIEVPLSGSSLEEVVITPQNNKNIEIPFRPDTES